MYMVTRASKDIKITNIKNHTNIIERPLSCTLLQKNLNSLVPIAWEELLHLTSVLTPSAVLAPLWTQESSFYSLNQPRVSSHMCISTCCSLFLKGSGLRAVYGKLWLLTIQVSAHMASTQKDLPGLPYLNSILIHYFLSNSLFFFNYYYFIISSHYSP